MADPTVESLEALSFSQFEGFVSGALAQLLPDVQAEREPHALTCRRLHAVVTIRETAAGTASLVFRHVETLVEGLSPLTWASLHEVIADVVAFLSGAPITTLTVHVRHGRYKNEVIERADLAPSARDAAG